MPRKSAAARRSFWPPRPAIVLFGLLALVALAGGGSRPDVLSLLFLRPLTVLLAGWALIGLDRGAIAGFRDWAVVLAMAAVLLTVQLLPLPAALWQALPGRELIVAIDQATGRSDLWRPLSLDPQMTRNALWALATPVAAFALAVRLESADHRRLLAAILLVGLVSGLLGVLQFASGAGGPFYLYRISNFGSAVGLFANRNHAGVFLACLFPLLAAFVLAQRDDGKRGLRAIGAAAMAAMLVPMILTTGSRAGLLIGALGLIGAALIVWPHRRGFARRRRSKVPPKGWLAALAAIGFLAFCAVFIGLAQGNSLDRLIGGDGALPEYRWSFWRVTAEAAVRFFPFGSGFGSFVRVFQVFEPDSLIKPTYANHAHNDFVEILLEGSVAGIALLAAALVLLARDGWRVWRAPPSSTELILARGAALALAQLVIASAFDYPLRTPLLAVVAPILVVWLRRGANAARSAQRMRATREA